MEQVLFGGLPWWQILLILIAMTAGSVMVFYLCYHILDFLLHLFKMNEEGRLEREKHGLWNILKIAIKLWLTFLVILLWIMIFKGAFNSLFLGIVLSVVATSIDYLIYKYL